MRSMIDFYTARPAMTAVLVVFAVAVAVLTVAFNTGGILLPLVFALLLGVLAGVVVAAFQRRD